MTISKKPFPTAKKLRGNKKTYLLVTLVMLLLLSGIATVLLHGASERRTRDYTQRARESIQEGDYEGALLYLRRIKDGENSPDVMMLMADCYEAMGNYPRALEMLRGLNTFDPAIASRIQTVEQRKSREARERQATVAGMAFDVDAQRAALDDMGLTDSRLSDITVLYALDILSLRDNQITDVSVLTQLKGLDELDLTGNRIRDLTPLCELTGLRSLTIDGNPVSDATALFGMRNLTYLSAVDTELSDEDLYALSEALMRCAIRFGVPGSENLLLAGESYDLHATELYLNNKGLTEIGVLSGFSNLHVLDISDNSISDLRPLMELAGLERLYLSHNEVSDLRPLIGLPLLNTLEADDNLIAETNSIGSVSTLRDLNLRGNRIQDYTGLGKLSRLTSLDLSGTGITDADIPALYPLKSLSVLNLQGNPGLSDRTIGALRSELPSCVISTSELVYEVNFSGHLVRSDERRLSFPGGGISDLSGLAKMTRLEELVLRDNEIVNLYPLEITPSRSSIRKLDLSGNRVTGVLSLYGLENLEELDLSGNRIETVAGLRALTNLKRLNLTGNPVALEAVEELREWLPECDIVF